MGKTQLCVEFARKCKERFSAVFWLDGSSKDALRQSLAGAAMRLPDRDTSASLHSSQASVDSQGPIDTLLQWLSRSDNTRWLLIFDNVDRDWQSVPKDPQAYDFNKFLPSADHGSILVTTRLARLQRPMASLNLRPVDDGLGRKILESRAGKQLQGE